MTHLTISKGRRSNQGRAESSGITTYLVYCEPRCRVGQLSEERGREAVVHRQNALIADDLARLEM